MIEEPEGERCPSCNVWYYVVWNRNPIYDGPEYCPFCGVELSDLLRSEEDEES